MGQRHRSSLLETRRPGKWAKTMPSNTVASESHYSLCYKRSNMLTLPRLSSRRIVIHTGAVKTGTSAFQTFCTRNRQRLLADHGLWYPHLSGDHPEKHQWLVGSFLVGDRQYYTASLEHLERSCPEEARTILMSTEGLSFHWARFSAAGRQLLDELIAQLSPTCIYVDREHAALLRSCYKQCVANPKVPGVWEFATGETFDVWRRYGDIAKRLDAAFMVGQYQEHFRADRVVVLTYSRRIVTDLLSVVIGQAMVEDEALRPENPSLDDSQTELLRLLNTQEMENAHRELVVAHLKSMGKIVPGCPEAMAVVGALQALAGTPVQASTDFAPDPIAVEALRLHLVRELMPDVL